MASFKGGGQSRKMMTISRTSFENFSIFLQILATLLDFLLLLQVLLLVSQEQVQEQVVLLPLVVEEEVVVVQVIHHVILLLLYLLLYCLLFSSQVHPFHLFQPLLLILVRQLQLSLLVLFSPLSSIAQPKMGMHYLWIFYNILLIIYFSKFSLINQHPQHCIEFLLQLHHPSSIPYFLYASFTSSQLSKQVQLILSLPSLKLFLYQNPSLKLIPSPHPSFYVSELQKWAQLIPFLPPSFYDSFSNASLLRSFLQAFDLSFLLISLLLFSLIFNLSFPPFLPSSLISLLFSLLSHPPSSPPSSLLFLPLSYLSLQCLSFCPPCSHLLSFHFVSY